MTIDTYRKILVATDFSDVSLRAVDAGARLARQAGAELTVVHVFDPAPIGPSIAIPQAAWVGADLGKQMKHGARGALNDVMERIGDSAAKPRLLEHSHAAVALCDFAEEEDYDLVVVGSHGRSGITRFLIGSVAESVVRHAPCPVLVVRGTVADQAALDDVMRKIFVCTNLSADSAPGLVAGARIARLLDPAPEVSLVMVEPPELAKLDEQARHRVRGELTEQLDVLHSAHFAGERNLALLTGKNPAETIVSHAAQASADLVVVATHGRSGVSRWVMGSVAERVTRHAPCSVLVARSNPGR